MYLTFGLAITQQYVKKKKSTRPLAVGGQERSCSEEKGVEYSKMAIKIG